MSPADLRAAVLAAGGSVDDLTSGPDWQMCAILPRERLRLLADAARIAWAYEEDFDRWANSRDAVTPLPRDAEQFAEMVAYLDANRWKRNEAFVSYREAHRWHRRAAAALALRGAPAQNAR